MNSIVALVCFVGVIIVLLALVLTAVRVVREYERMVVFRLGRLLSRAKERPAGDVGVSDREDWVSVRERWDYRWVGLRCNS